MQETRETTRGKHFLQVAKSPSKVAVDGELRWSGALAANLSFLLPVAGDRNVGEE